MYEETHLYNNNSLAEDSLYFTLKKRLLGVGWIALYIYMFS